MFLLADDSIIHMKKDSLVEEVISNLDLLNRIILATVEIDQPRLRPVTMIYIDSRLFVTTASNTKKVEQLRKNNKVEFLLLVPDSEGNTGYIRGKCLVSFIDDDKIKNILYERVPHVSQLWEGPNDTALTVMELCPLEYDYMKPGDFYSTIICL